MSDIPKGTFVRLHLETIGATTGHAVNAVTLASGWVDEDGVFYPKDLTDATGNLMIRKIEVMEPVPVEDDKPEPIWVAYVLNDSTCHGVSSSARLNNPGYVETLCGQPVLRSSPNQFAAQDDRCPMCDKVYLQQNRRPLLKGDTPINDDGTLDLTKVKGTPWSDDKVGTSRWPVSRPASGDLTVHIYKGGAEPPRDLLGKGDQWQSEKHGDWTWDGLQWVSPEFRINIGDDYILLREGQTKPYGFTGGGSDD